jgi:hypothetical protein
VGATFGQKDVDRIVKHRLRKAEEEQKKLLGEMNALRARADLTKEERTDWEKRVEQLNNSLLSTEELAAKERKKAEEQHARVLQEKEEAVNLWKERYTHSTIQRSLTDAAIQHKSFYPEQIVQILDRNTRLVEELHDGKPTGRLVPKVTFEDVDKEGKPVTLTLSPLEAVKRMTEVGKYQNLFEGTGVGGVGGRNHPVGGKKDDLASLAKGDLKSYLQGRRDGTISLD